MKRLGTNNILFRTIILLLTLTLVSCSTTRLLKEKEYLLVKNSVKIDQKRKITTDEISGYIQQKPNKKFLGLFRFSTWIYLKTNKPDQSKFKNWLHRVAGKKPVTLDTNIANNSARQIALYLNNKGYFNSDVYKKVK